MIRFTHRHVGTNSDAYISSSLNIEVSQDQQQFFLSPHVEDLNTRYLALANVGKVDKEKIANRRLERLGAIKACIGLYNSEDRFKRLKGHLELTNVLAEVGRMYQTQKS